MNDKIGIVLTAALGLASPSSYYPPRRHDSTTNLAQFFTPVTQTPVLAVSSCGTAGISTTNTTIGDHLFTSTCTGTLNFSVHGAGGSSVSPGGGGGGGGGGAYAEAALTVNTGDVLRNFVGSASVGSDGGISFWCFTSNTACTTSATVCSALTITSTTGVCADGGKTAGVGGNGGQTAASVGVTLFAGGSGGSQGGGGSGGGGGAAGPDGGGVSGSASGGAGGNGDNGSGGAGGPTETAGTSNVKGGGGGGGGVFNPPGAGGAPGGGGGGYGLLSGGTAVGARGQGIVKS